LELQTERAAVVVVEAEANLRRARVGRAVAEAAEVRVLDRRRLRRRDERRVVLAEEDEADGLLRQPSVNAHPGESERRLAGADRRDVAIVRAREVALEVKLEAARDDSLRRGVEPLEVRAEPEAARSEVKLRRARRPRVGGEQRQREVVALRRRGVVDEARLKEAVELQARA
jgi:hypothetical protein